MATRYWTVYWQGQAWQSEVNQEYSPFHHSAGNIFRKRGITPGDFAYLVSVIKGRLFLGGRMQVSQILSDEEAIKYFNHSNFYEAEEHLIGVEGSDTLINLHRKLSTDLTRKLRFETKTGPKPPFFVKPGELDRQALRGVRELTLDSAKLFDKIIAATDKLPRNGKLITVTKKLLNASSPSLKTDLFQLPEEPSPGEVFQEGAIKRIEVNRYERDPKARKICIDTHGSNCSICDMSFGAMYGPDFEGYIHVHHLTPLSEVGDGYEIDPVKELMPVCPNCHAALHKGGRCLTISEVKQLIAKQSQSVSKS